MKLTLTRDLTPLKDQAKARIDAEAEAIRLHYITNGSGQQMVYQQKYDEAVAYLADSNAPAPHIHAEVGITAATAEGVAQAVIAMRNQWITISAAIEQKRLGAKAAVDAASTPAAIYASSVVDWAPY